jgi:hypothetical protein
VEHTSAAATGQLHAVLVLAGSSGGIGAHVRSLAQGLNAHGLEVTVSAGPQTVTSRPCALSPWASERTCAPMPPELPARTRTACSWPVEAAEVWSTVGVVSLSFGHALGRI